MEESKNPKAEEIIGLLLKRYNGNIERVYGFIDATLIWFNYYDNEFIQKVDRLLEKLNK